MLGMVIIAYLYVRRIAISLHLLPRWGRYRYRTAPQGYIASSDGYTRRYDEIVADIPNKTKCVDDALLWANNLEDCFFQAINWLVICERNGIMLNPDKFIFRADIVEFAGFEITNNDVCPCRKYLQEILDFSTPKNITDVRSWFGLVNQVSYAFSTADRMLPFQELLRPGIQFKWNEDLEALFQESKAAITAEIEHGTASLIQINQPAWRLTGQSLALDSGSYRNIVAALKTSILVGRSH